MFPPIRLREALTLGGLSVRELAIRTWRKMNENEIMTRAAAVAFYAMLALVPFLGLVITLTAQLLPDLTGKAENPTGIGHLTVREMESTLRALLPAEAYDVFEVQIKRLQEQPPVGLISLGVVVTLWLASSLFVAIIDALNRVYGVHETRSFVKVRRTAIVMTIVETVVLVGSLITIVAWPQIVGWLGFSAQAAALATVVQWVVVTVMVLLSFALAFYFGPDAEQRWEWITPGSLVGTVVFLVVTHLFRVYVQHFANYNKTYGALGGVMVLLFWFWISSLVLLGAGQMNKLIEDASPLGKSIGQKTDPTVAPDLGSLTPEPAEVEGSKSG
jgi:membrane protein